MPQPGLEVTPSIRLIEKLGEGGMGTVWIADHLGLHTRVVVKFMAAELASNAELVRRFSQEAAAAAQVKHPNVVQVLDHGATGDGVSFIVMELLEGTDLATRMAKERPLLLPHGEVAHIVSQTAHALARAHARGLVHRDIKPENIFLCEVGGDRSFVKVLDFGIAKFLQPAPGDATRTGMVIGTPYYMSPEQHLGSKNLDHRSDIWSLGVLVFSLLTGRLPFEGESLAAIIASVLQQEPPRPTAVNPALPSAIDAWFTRACARDPEARFQSARDLADSLGSALAAAPARVDQAPAPGHAIAPPAEARPTAVIPSALAANGGSPGPRRRALQPHMLWLTGVGVVLVGAIIFIVARATSSNEVELATIGDEITTFDASLPPVTSRQPSPGAAREEKQAPDDVVELRFKVTPPVARVELDGVVISEPVLRVHKGEKFKFVVSAPGYVTETKEVQARMSGEIVISLKRNLPCGGQKRCQDGSCPKNGKCPQVLPGIDN